MMKILNRRISVTLSFLIWILSMFYLTPAWADVLPEPPIADSPAVSPDGTTIVFVSQGYSDTKSLWVAKRDGSNARKLFDWDEGIQVEPDWSPDGQHIVFRSGRHIWRVDRGGGNVMRLTMTGTNSHPRYSPDGSKILYESDRSGKQELWFMGADGSDQQLTNIPYKVTEPEWSPDGTSIVYSYCNEVREGEPPQNWDCHIYTYSLATGTEQQLTTGDSYNVEPDWGTLGIVFRSNRNGSEQLWLVNSDGTSLRPLSGSDGIPREPVWDHSTNTVIFDKSNQLWSTDLHGHEVQLTHFMPNEPPKAIAGHYEPFECSSTKGALVTLDGRQSYDPNGEPIEYFYWQSPFGFTTGPTAQFEMPIGTHSVELIVEVDPSQEATDTIQIEIVDTTPPSITDIQATPNILWPPNHKMVSTQVQVNASDLCSEQTSCKIIGVETVESENSVGDGNTEPDWILSRPLVVELRAERSAKSKGRSYIIAVECTDNSGNAVLSEVAVSVPLKQPE